MPNEKKLENGLLVPTTQIFTNIHDEVLKESMATHNFAHAGMRDDSILDYLCNRLELHRYKENMVDNIYYVGTEIFFNIACRHPFADGNKRSAYISALTFIGVNFSRNFSGARVYVTENEKQGRVIETIAKWGEGSDYSELEKLIRETGIVKTERKINENDVKSFINSFLRNTIRFEQVQK